VNRRLDRTKMNIYHMRKKQKNESNTDSTWVKKRLFSHTTYSIQNKQHIVSGTRLLFHKNEWSGRLLKRSIDWCGWVKIKSRGKWGEERCQRHSTAVQKC
jgi:hypothetical protein